MDAKCATCGNPADKISSGSPECWDCWNWRKLDGPAARYWIDRLQQAENLLFEQGPDMHDVETWGRWGIANEVAQMLHGLGRLRQLYEAQRDAEMDRRDRSREARVHVG